MSNLDEINEYVAEVIEQRIEQTKNLLVVKGKEYTRNNDRLHNFRRTSKITGQTMEKSLNGFLMKHIVSYLDILDDLEKDINVNPATVREKIGDIIVYMHLQEAIILNKIRLSNELKPKPQPNE